MAESLNLTCDDRDLLRRAAYVHEIGLVISHGGYHRHGAYLLQHSDIPGFSQIDQKSSVSAGGLSSPQVAS